MFVFVYMYGSLYRQQISNTNWPRQTKISSSAPICVYIYYWKERDKEEEMKERWKKREKQHFLYYLIV